MRVLPALAGCGHSPSALLAAAAALRRLVSSAASGVDLLDLQYLHTAVGPLAQLDGHVLRHEGAADAHPVPLPVDQVALQFWKQRHRTSISSKLLLNFPDQEEEAWFCPPLVGFSFPADLACGGAPS